MSLEPQRKPEKRLNYRQRFLAGEVVSKPRQRVKAVSNKRVREGGEYDGLKKEYLAEHLFCEMPDCHNTDLEIHHKARRGKFFLRTDTWMAVCHQHHMQIEYNPEWAKENGYLLTPEQRRAIA